MPRQRGLKARLNRLESHAHATMDDGQKAIFELKELVAGLIEEIEDGFELELVVDPESLLNLISPTGTGDGRTLPFSLRVKLREEDDETP